MLVSAGEFGCRKFDQAVRQCRLLAHGRRQGGAGRLDQRGVRDRLDANPYAEGVSTRKRATVPAR